MRKVSKVKNLAGLLDLASIPQYQNGGETTYEVTLPEVEVYGDQLRRDMQRTGLTYDELANLNYGAQRQSQIQGRLELPEIEINPLTGNPATRHGDFLYDNVTGQKVISVQPLEIVSPEFDLLTLGGVRFPMKFKPFDKLDDLTPTIGKKTFKNWGSENYVTEQSGYFYKIPKSKVTPMVVSEKRFDERSLARYIRKKLRFNELPASEKIEYVGYIKTGNKYVPVLKQRAVQTRGDKTIEDKLFNQKALQDIQNKFNKANYSTSDVTAHNKWYNVFDYGPGHNIGISSDGTGVIYDAMLGESIAPQFLKTISENYQFVNPFKHPAQLLNPAHFRGFLNTQDDAKQESNYSDGGIHIKKKNRGKFTETMKRTGKTAEELKHSKNPLTRKRATFDINSRKWAKKK